MTDLKSHTLTLSPSDVLFFKDGRPMEGASSGHGAAWPLPNVIDSALHHALRRADLQDAHCHTRKRSGKELSSDRSREFGSLQSAGPFPILDGTWYFPRPADADEAGTPHSTHRPLGSTPSGTSSSLDTRLQPVVNTRPPSKDKAEPWLNKEAFDAYLNNQSAPKSSEFIADEAIFCAEHTIGIGIDPQSGTQDGKSFYTASYLRLTPKAEIGMVAKCWDKGTSGEVAQQDFISSCFPNSGATTQILAGGQQRTCSVKRNSPSKLPLPSGPKLSGNYVRWTLLTPAIFPELSGTHSHSGGWLPTWIDQETLEVQLKDPTQSQRNGQGRSSWRKAVAKLPAIKAKLVAATIPRAIPITGWSLGKDDNAFGARATHLAVPAGAVYYFETDSEEEAQNLADALNWHGLSNGSEIQNRRSSIFGEKGFGLGVCSSWTPHQ